MHQLNPVFHFERREFRTSIYAYHFAVLIWEQADKSGLTRSKYRLRHDGYAY